MCEYVCGKIESERLRITTTRMGNCAIFGTVRQGQEKVNVKGADKKELLQNAEIRFKTQRVVQGGRHDRNGINAEGAA